MRVAGLADRRVRWIVPKRNGPFRPRSVTTQMAHFLPTTSIVPRGGHGHSNGSLTGLLMYVAVAYTRFSSCSARRESPCRSAVARTRATADLFRGGRAVPSPRRPRGSAETAGLSAAEGGADQLVRSAQVGEQGPSSRPGLCVRSSTGRRVTHSRQGPFSRTTARFS